MKQWDKAMNKKMMTSIKLQKKLHYKMQQRVIADGYGMRGKSRWIIEAIENLLGLPDYPSLVDIADDMDQLSEIISIRLPETLMLQIDHSIIEVRRNFPAMEGVKSNIIRASIIQRLIRSTTSVTEV
jgi:metal-responsive CopG/Arc/MetJ family transcriptional regulator